MSSTGADQLADAMDAWLRAAVELQRREALIAAIEQHNRQIAHFTRAVEAAHNNLVQAKDRLTNAPRHNLDELPNLAELGAKIDELTQLGAALIAADAPTEPALSLQREANAPTELGQVVEPIADLGDPYEDNALIDGHP